ncbi:Protein BRICK1 [Zea mays]|uniref:Protein BRICK1 n=1 Tax=Zea mays TaxID=4577 RepID=A0A3L6EKU5_MAIZE|nr:Protein BRICK1 [Zea mays]
MGRGGGMGNPVNVGIAVQADWENREFISNISLNVRRLFDFLLRFDNERGGGTAPCQMMNSQKLQLPVQDLMSLRGRSFIISKVMMHQCTAAASSSSSPAPAARGLQVAAHPSSSRRRRPRGLVAAAGSDDDECASAGGESESSSSGGKDDGGGGLSREDLERLVGSDEDAKFNGLDLANLIRKKYGRSYDVTLIKKRSFPLSEEEYLLRLDDVANTLKCWGAVAHVRNTLEKLKERPRIGKAVSIFIDMDQTGGRSNEWIYK